MVLGSQLDENIFSYELALSSRQTSILSWEEITIQIWSWFLKEIIMTIIIDLSCSLADPDMTDGSLQSRVADLPRNTILLLEDIDAAFNSRFAFFQTFV